MNKVYCNRCKFLVSDHLGNNCDAKENINVIVKEDNWLDKITETIYLKHPSEINENNDCKWYQNKPISRYEDIKDCLYPGFGVMNF